MILIYKENLTLKGPLRHLYAESVTCVTKKGLNLEQILDEAEEIIVLRERADPLREEAYPALPGSV